MKNIYKLISVLAIALLCLSVTSKPAKETKRGTALKEKTFDSCEYIYFVLPIFGGGGAGGLTHKGNCSNPIHKK